MIEKGTELKHAQLFFGNNCGRANSFSLKRRRWQPAELRLRAALETMCLRMTDKVIENCSRFLATLGMTVASMRVWQEDGKSGGSKYYPFAQHYLPPLFHPRF